MQTQVQVQSFNVQQTSPQEGREAAKMKKILRGLGITEAVIGMICCIMGILLMANVYSQPHYAYVSSYYYGSYPSYTSGYRSSLKRLYLVNLGEGLWSGIWILIAGILGAACGKKTVTPCLLNSYLAFSIVASIFAINMFGINVPFAIIYSSPYQRYSFGVGVEGTLAFLSFTAFVICIVSACYCCCASMVITKSPSCCGTCCGSGIQPTGGYVVSTVGTNAGMQPVVQGSPMFVQG
uniref:Uncharacterized protein LOC100182868 n=1 Tax=Phallusia mammillata TaxID=59560 RepID=A0A6F9DH72_9ASCI|nr:uncharacterized protein LOC100182868 [Phallusia mammillata]